MSEAFAFFSHRDNPAMVAVSTPEFRSAISAALHELGYKVLCVEDHDEFVARYNAIPFQVVIMEETFASGGVPGQSPSVQWVQWLPMPQRRQAVFILLGDLFGTLNSMQAYQQSVHAVVNYSEAPIMSQIIQKVAAENDAFYSTYREIQKHALKAAR